MDQLQFQSMSLKDGAEHPSRGNPQPPKSMSSNVSVPVSQQQDLTRMALMMVKEAKKILKSRNGPAFQLKDMKQLGVELHSLDLTKDCPTNMLRPVPLAMLDRWLQEARPWERRGYGSGRSEHNENEAWWNASLLCGDLSSYATYGYDCMAPGAMYTYTKWSHRMRSLPNRMNRKRFWFDMEDIYEVRDQDMRLPHFNCLVAQDMRLDDDTYSYWELFTMVALLQKRYQDGGLRETLTVPITIFSAGDRQCRVIHGYFDLEKRKLVWYMSPVMNFADRGHCKREEFKLLLCWLMAEPIPV